eukprot:1158562-Pelagomonas_calceolata.AAC.4
MTTQPRSMCSSSCKKGAGAGGGDMGAQIGEGAGGGTYAGSSHHGKALSYFRQISKYPILQNRMYSWK